MLDLSELKIIDAHIHRPERMTLSGSYEMWNSSFVDATLPHFDFDTKDEMQTRLSKTFQEHLETLPRLTGLLNYVSRVYGCNPTLQDLDAVISKNLRGEFSSYIRSVMDREKIVTVVLDQSFLPDKPNGQPGDLLPDRYVWTYPIVRLIQPDWAENRGAKSIGEVLERIDDTIDLCVANGCSGLKSAVAYYRPLAIDRVEEDQADAALKSLLTSQPAGYIHFPAEIPRYDDSELTNARRLYQDYLLKYLYVKAGRVGLPLIIHTAVALHPALSFKFNNPLGLYDIIQDDDIKRVETKFVLIHTGFPFHHYVASMISQFPNVFADVSFFSQFPGILEETLRTFLQLAPSEKVMHGSDSDIVPEVMGYCASNIRQTLVKILNDFESDYGWTEKNCLRAARNVMSENARRVFRIDNPQP